MTYIDFSTEQISEQQILGETVRQTWIYILLYFSFFVCPISFSCEESEFWNELLRKFYRRSTLSYDEYPQMSEIRIQRTRCV